MPDRGTSHLIIGAGPVGLTAALELKRRGITPTIIDNDGEPTPESRALAINPRSLEILEASGVTERLINAGNKINGLIIKNNHKLLTQFKISDIPHRYNFLLILPQSNTEEIFIQALKEQGIDVNWHTALENVAPHDQSFTCTVQAKQQQRAIETTYLIGADGAHSTVRKALNIPFDGESLLDEWSLADVELSEWPHPFDHAVINLTNQGPIAFFPLSEGRARLVSTQPDLLNNLPKAAKLNKVIWQSKFKISYRQVSTYQKGNAFLAGDAAHIHSPAGGRGMNLGIEDAATLAFLMANNKQEKYSKMRHPIGQKILKTTEQQTNMITSNNILVKLSIKFLTPILLNIPPLRLQALKRLSGLDTPTPEWLQ